MGVRFYFLCKRIDNNFLTGSREIDYILECEESELDSQLEMMAKNNHRVSKIVKGEVVEFETRTIVKTASNEFNNLAIIFPNYFIQSVYWLHVVIQSR